MLRTLIAILFILLGLVGIAGGVWGLSLQASSDVNPQLLSVAQTVLEYTDGAMETADDWLSGLTGGKSTFTGLLNGLTGDNVDLTNEASVKLFVMLHAVEVLMGGIIGVETGLLLFKSRR